MAIISIRNARDHKAALREIDKLLAVRKLTEAQSRRLDALTILVDAYEEKAFPMGGLDPVDLIKAHMLNSGRTQMDLAVLIGPALASLILSRQRALSLEAIRKISTAWGIPADLLIKPYELTAKRA
ncbi:MAG: helix-turn-helix domain-containing protein [Dongiaceae bacterium]